MPCGTRLALQVERAERARADAQVADVHLQIRKIARIARVFGVAGAVRLGLLQHQPFERRAQRLRAAELLGNQDLSRRTGTVDIDAPAGRRRLQHAAHVGPSIAANSNVPTRTLAACR